MRLAARALLVLVAAACAASFRAVPLVSLIPLIDDARVPVLIELFTSEGCSSCPPADLLLREIGSGAATPAARPIILSEHVDYFNHDGWKDPYSQALFTVRQTVYDNKRGEPFTPEMIVDGSEHLTGSDRQAALDAIARVARRPKATLTLSWQAATSQLAISSRPGPDAAGARLYLALTQDGLTQAVRAGENKGRQLTHDGVVRQLTAVGSVNRQGVVDQTIAVRPDVRWGSPIRAVVFIQREGGPVLAVGDTPIR